MKGMNRLQNQMRRQQEQLRRQQMGAAWMEQQKAKKQPLEIGQLSDNPFLELEALVSYLRKEYAARRITKEAAEEQLRANLIEDDDGVLWTVGFETGEWYRLVDGKWQKAARPVAVVSAKAAAAKQAAPAKPKNLKGFFTFLVGLFLSWILGVLIAGILFEAGIVQEYDQEVVMYILWALGAYLSYLWGGKVRRGEIGK